MPLTTTATDPSGATSKSSPVADSLKRATFPSRDTVLR